MVLTLSFIKKEPREGEGFTDEKKDLKLSGAFYSAKRQIRQNGVFWLWLSAEI